MKAENFCYWLQGFLEIGNPESITGEQLQVVKNHLNLVFLHDIDPKQGLNKQQSAQAQAVHDGKASSPGFSISETKMRC